jgi:divalent metal cation (Fe/Co/Zn/Cd) transporter
MGLLLAYFGMGRADTVVALGMGCFIMYSGVGVVRENIGMLMGERPDQAFYERVEVILTQHAKVQNLLEIRAHRVGDRVHLAASVEVDGRLSLLEAHAIELELEARLQEIQGISETFLHLVPASVGD